MPATPATPDYVVVPGDTPPPLSAEGLTVEKNAPSCESDNCGVGDTQQVSVPCVAVVWSFGKGKVDAPEVDLGCFTYRDVGSSIGHREEEKEEEGGGEGEEDEETPGRGCPNLPMMIDQGLCGGAQNQECARQNSFVCRDKSIARVIRGTCAMSRGEGYADGAPQLPLGGKRDRSSALKASGLAMACGRRHSAPVLHGCAPLTFGNRGAGRPESRIGRPYQGYRSRKTHGVGTTLVRFDKKRTARLRSSPSEGCWRRWDTAESRHSQQWGFRRQTMEASRSRGGEKYAWSAWTESVGSQENKHRGRRYSTGHEQTTARHQQFWCRRHPLPLPSPPKEMDSRVEVCGVSLGDSHAAAVGSAGVVCMWVTDAWGTLGYGHETASKDSLRVSTGGGGDAAREGGVVMAMHA